MENKYMLGVIADRKCKESAIVLGEYGEMYEITHTDWARYSTTSGEFFYTWSGLEREFMPGDSVIMHVIDNAEGIVNQVISFDWTGESSESKALLPRYITPCEFRRGVQGIPVYTGIVYTLHPFLPCGHLYVKDIDDIVDFHALGYRRRVTYRDGRNRWLKDSWVRVPKIDEPITAVLLDRGKRERVYATIWTRA